VKVDHHAAYVRKVVYWLVVFLLSLALIVGLVLLLESRDSSSVSFANTTMRLLAL
jgi:uncharacterized membrane protein